MSSIKYTPGQCVYPDCKEIEYVFKYLCSEHQPGNEDIDDDLGRQGEYSYRISLREAAQEKAQQDLRLKEGWIF